MKAGAVEHRAKLPARSVRSLNAANFFQAEMVGVILPVLNAFLREAHWQYGGHWRRYRRRHRRTRNAPVSNARGLADRQALVPPHRGTHYRSMFRHDSARAAHPGVHRFAPLRRGSSKASSLRYSARWRSASPDTVCPIESLERIKAGITLAISAQLSPQWPWSRRWASAPFSTP